MKFQLGDNVLVRRRSSVASYSSFDGGFEGIVTAVAQHSVRVSYKGFPLGIRRERWFPTDHGKIKVEHVTK